VRKWQGVLEAESAPAPGTTVRAILPIPHKEASPTAVGEAPNERKIAKGPSKEKGKGAGR
jgi:hypothetical protein